MDDQRLFDDYAVFHDVESADVGLVGFQGHQQVVDVFSKPSAPLGLANVCGRRVCPVAWMGVVEGQQVSSVISSLQHHVELLLGVHQVSVRVAGCVSDAI